MAVVVSGVCVWVRALLLIPGTSRHPAVGLHGGARLVAPWGTGGERGGEKNMIH